VAQKKNVHAGGYIAVHVDVAVRPERTTWYAPVVLNKQTLCQFNALERGREKKASSRKAAKNSETLLKLFLASLRPCTRRFQAPKL
jgi:hypothetical protein